jgi:catalase
VVGHLRDGVTPPVLERAIVYWRNVDSKIGERVAEGVREKLKG